MDRVIEAEGKFVTIPKEHYDELLRKANDSEYYRGKIDGMEYVIDSIADAFKERGGE